MYRNEKSMCLGVRHKLNGPLSFICSFFNGYKLGAKSTILIWDKPTPCCPPKGPNQSYWFHEDFTTTLSIVARFAMVKAC